ncbi:MAG: ABC transporter ATP-binding protein [Anaerolineales bacterium]|nr:ABC transporter ATP-binding protein [Anaerolineales bacterium]
MTAHILEIKDLATRFHTDSGIVNAVNGVSYTLGEGETLGVVGESGCGKSVHALSLMRLIPIPPGDIYQGEVLYKGRDLLKIPDNDMRRIRGGEIAMIFQDPMTSLNPVMTIGKQITEALHLHTGMDDLAARERATEMLDLVGISEAKQHLDSYPHEFSGGMRQRAMIAMSLSCSPSILIADEPTTALDVTIQAQIIDLIRRLRDKLGMAIIWITHDLGIMAGLAEKLNVMYAGYIVEKAPVKQLYGDPRHPYTLGLLKSLPRVDQRKKGERLIPIDGRPPDLLGLPIGCPFESRCTFAIDRCRKENPALESVDTDHEIACWVDVKTGKPREVVA